jgi:hypothetical protein
MAPERKLKVKRIIAMNLLKSISRRLMLTLVSVVLAYVVFAAVMASTGVRQLSQSGIIS